QTLYLIDGPAAVTTKIVPVASLHPKQKPIGTAFFRDTGFQWSPDSQRFYLIKDEYYDTLGSQLFSKKGELYTYDIADHELVKVLAPFQGAKVAFGPNGRIIYAQPTPTGDLELKSFDGTKLQDVRLMNDRSLWIQGHAEPLHAPLFYTFRWTEYRHKVLEQKGVETRVGHRSAEERG